MRGNSIVLSTLIAGSMIVGLGFGAGCAGVDWSKRYLAAEQQRVTSEDAVLLRKVIDAATVALKERKDDRSLLVPVDEWKVSSDSTFYYVRVDRHEENLNDILLLDRLTSIVVLKKLDLQCVVVILQ